MPKKTNLDNDIKDTQKSKEIKKTDKTSVSKKKVNTTSKETTKKEPVKKTSVKKAVPIDKEKVVEFKVIDDKKDLKESNTFEMIIVLVIVALLGTMIGFVARGKFKTNNDDNYTVVNKEIQTFIDQYNYILDNYYGEIDKNELIANAIQGMLSSLDDHSTFINNGQSNSLMISLEGQYEGLGVEIYNNASGEIVILTVFDNSSASEAGLQPNDIVVSLNGESLEGKTTSEFVEMVKKNPDKDFKLGVKRKDETLELNVTKRKVVLESVHSQVLDNNIGYIIIDIFAENTDGQFKKALNDLEGKKIESLIIDVRNNSGGHLSAVENMLYEFFDSSHIIYQTESNTEKKVVYSKGTKNKDYSIVVLTNGNSASASEILAATLSEEYGAYLIGETTYGKGTVQELRNVGEIGQYKFTTKKWLTPKGNWINGVGIKPNKEVTLDENYMKNPSYENDNQLQEAIKYLNELKD